MYGWVVGAKGRVSSFLKRMLGFPLQHRQHFAWKGSAQQKGGVEVPHWDFAHFGKLLDHLVELSFAKAALENAKISPNRTLDARDGFPVVGVDAVCQEFVHALASLEIGPSKLLHGFGLRGVPVEGGIAELLHGEVARSAIILVCQIFDLVDCGRPITIPPSILIRDPRDGRLICGDALILLFFDECDRVFQRGSGLSPHGHLFPRKLLFVDVGALSGFENDLTWWVSEHFFFFRGRGII